MNRKNFCHKATRVFFTAAKSNIKLQENPIYFRLALSHQQCHMLLLGFQGCTKFGHTKTERYKKNYLREVVRKMTFGLRNIRGKF